MSAAGIGDGHVLDRLYTEEGAKVAMEWLWGNMRSLTKDLECAAGSATYVAWHAVKRFTEPSEGFEMTAEDASFLALAHEFVESQGHVIHEESQAGSRINPDLLQALLAVAMKLMEAWLRNRP